MRGSRALWESSGLETRIWVPVAKLSWLLHLGGCGGKFWLSSHMAVFGHLGSPFGVSELFSDTVNFPVRSVTCWHAPTSCENVTF